MNERRDWAPVDWSPMKRLIYLRGNGATGGGGSPLTVTGATPLLMPGAVAKPLMKATFQISPVQSGSGDPSPQNIRAITGWTAANCYVNGANLFDEEWETGSINISTGQNSSSNDTRTKNYIAMPTGKQFTICWDMTETGSAYCLLCAYKADKSFSRYIGAFSNSKTSFLLNPDEGFVRFYRYGNNTPLVNCRIVSGFLIDAPYTPYSGSTVSVEFPASVGTVYSGTIDPVTGEGAVTHKCVTFDGTEPGWNNYGNPTNGFALNPGDMKTGTRLAGMSNWLKVPTSVQASGTPYCYLGFGNAYIYITDVIGNVGSVSDMASWKAYLTEHPLQVVYPLADPIPFTVTPQTLTPPAWDAYIWADCGSTAEVTYIGKP